MILPRQKSPKHCQFDLLRARIYFKNPNSPAVVQTVVKAELADAGKTPLQNCRTAPGKGTHLFKLCFGRDLRQGTAQANAAFQQITALAQIGYE